MTARSIRSLAGATVFASVALAPLAAAAQEVPNGPDWAFGEPAAEVGLALASAASMAFYFLPQRISDWGPSGARETHATYATMSDFSGSFIGSGWQLTGSWALEVGYYEQHHVPEPFGLAARTTLMDLESMLLATGLNQAVKRLAGRCRPRAWRNNRCEGEQYDAFPSGHVTPVSAIAGSRLLLAARSTGAPERRYLAFGFSEGASLFTAVMRVLAGAHSWEDVLVGVAMGHAIGAGVALAHPMKDSIEPGQAVAASMLSWSGRF